MIILDTCILIDIIHYDLSSQSEKLTASILSRAELEFGVQESKDPAVLAERMRQLRDFDARLDWLPFDIASSTAYGIIAEKANAKGAKLRSKDALIAAQAYQHGAALMTANLDDFKPFEHLIQIIPPPA